MNFCIGWNADCVTRGDAAGMFAGPTDANEIAFLQNGRVRGHFIQTAFSIVKEAGFGAKFGVNLNFAWRTGCYPGLSRTVDQFDSRGAGDDEFAVGDHAWAGSALIAAVSAIHDASGESAR